jgi:hypothetical protein
VWSLPRRRGEDPVIRDRAGHGVSSCSFSFVLATPAKSRADIGVIVLSELNTEVFRRLGEIRKEKRAEVSRVAGSTSRR